MKAACMLAQQKKCWVKFYAHILFSLLLDFVPEVLDLWAVPKYIHELPYLSTPLPAQFRVLKCSIFTFRSNSFNVGLFVSLCPALKVSFHFSSIFIIFFRAFIFLSHPYGFLKIHVVVLSSLAVPPVWMVSYTYFPILIILEVMSLLQKCVQVIGWYKKVCLSCWKDFMISPWNTCAIYINPLLAHF